MPATPGLFFRCLPLKKHGFSWTSITKQDVVTLPYDIPLWGLIARDVDGLMMAGRCISGDFIAHASYRVTGNAVAMGEAAGTIAAIAAQTNRLPHDAPWTEGALVLAKTRAHV